ncbi:MAG TPA: glycosyltransferase family 87 protein [Terracidiphilus sp.]|nr:glycosyltransferase family 87 protein [Terracidiphilus sp.]
MKRTRLDGLYLLVLGSLVFLLLGGALENAGTSSLADFRALYYPARCLIQHCDPYNQSEVMRFYRAEGASRFLNSVSNLQIATQNVYPPTAFLLSVPMALLPWGPAHILWMALTAGSFIFASFLIWNLSERYAPTPTGALLCFLLANSELVLICGNVAGIVVSLCVVAVWCFLRDRFVWAGILCLAISLAVKPHDVGLVWLFFLLAGGLHRKRALQTLVLTVAISLPALVWIWQVSPHWIQELHFNLQAFSAHGGINDPGPASTGGHGLDMLISLQSVFSFFWDDPRIYNPATLLVCVPLLLVWAFVTVRAQPSPKKFWLGLAVIAALSMLPIYHRQIDAMLLILTVPACVMLWAEGRFAGRLAMLINGLGFVAIGALPWAILLGFINHLHLPATGLSRQIANAVQVLPIPLILLSMSVFYLSLYVHYCPVPRSAGVNPER